MPEPIQIVMPTFSQGQRQRNQFDSELNHRLFNLRRSTTYIHDGVEYKFDFEEYEIRTNMFRFQYHQAQNDYDNGTITKEHFEDVADSYFTNICTYYLVDVDGKECGKFNTYTREYIMFLRRIEIDSNVYYCDVYNRVENYRGIEVGQLAENANIVLRMDS